MTVQRARRIALVGAACTGKTTAFEAARKAAWLDAPRVHWLEEVARQVIRQEAALTPADAVLQQRILHHILEVESALPEADLVVSDRCALDPIVYLHALGEERLAATLLEEHQAGLVRVDRFLLFHPDGVPYTDDPDRRDGATFRTTVHRSFEAILDHLSAPITLVRGDIPTRTLAVQDAITAILSLPSR